MKKLKLIPAFILAVLFFSLFSGCKIKQKQQQKSTEVESSETKLSTSVSSQKTDSNERIKTDQSVLKSDEIQKYTNTRSVKLTIDLDSNQNLSVDSAGRFSLNALVNSALKNARRIQIEAQDQQSSEKHKLSSTALDKKELQTNVKKETSDSTKNQTAKNNKEVKKAETAIVKDSSVKQNLGSPAILIIIVLVVLWLFFSKNKD